MQCFTPGAQGVCQAKPEMISVHQPYVEGGLDFLLAGDIGVCP